MPDEKRIVVTAGEYEVEVVEANRGQGIDRLIYMEEADVWLEAQGYTLGKKGEGLLEIPVAIRRRYLWLRMERSSCVAAAAKLTRAGERLEPPGCEEFLSLPDALVSEWSAAVARLNPHWTGREDRDEPPEKKDDASATPAG